MSTDGVWSLPKRVAFRFGFVAGALFIYPFPIGTLPKTTWLSEQLNKPWEWLVLWVGDLLGYGHISTEQTGSGDTTFGYLTLLTIAILAAIGAAVWSIADRRRLGYPRLARWSLVMLRYVLGLTMLSYGFAKIVDTQFPAPSHAQLDGRLGDMSPMSVLWKFMGSSMTYTIFGGLAEAIGGTLLLWRRTSTLGAIIVMGVLTNVVMLNFCYDVPVKIYSSQLLVVAAVIAAPQLRRMWRAVLGGAVPAVPEPPRTTPRRERIWMGARALAIALVAYSIYQEVDASMAYRRTVGPLDGIWVVETWTVDGVERPPLTTDGERWRKLIVDDKRAQVRLMTDVRQRAAATIVPADHTLQLTIGEAPPDAWTYARPDPGHLVLDGTRGSAKVHVTLVLEPEPLLVTRGFHWVNEFPFNK